MTRESPPAISGGGSLLGERVGLGVMGGVGPGVVGDVQGPEIHPTQQRIIVMLNVILALQYLSVLLRQELRLMIGKQWESRSF